LISFVLNHVDRSEFAGKMTRSGSLIQQAGDANSQYSSLQCLELTLSSYRACMGRSTIVQLMAKNTWNDVVYQYPEDFSLSFKLLGWHLESAPSDRSRSRSSCSLVHNTQRCMTILLFLMYGIAWMCQWLKSRDTLQASGRKTSRLLADYAVYKQHWRDERDNWWQGKSKSANVL